MSYPQSSKEKKQVRLISLRCMTDRNSNEEIGNASEDLNAFINLEND